MFLPGEGLEGEDGGRLVVGEEVREAVEDEVGVDEGVEGARMALIINRLCAIVSQLIGINKSNAVKHRTCSCCHFSWTRNA